jgi:hypothetical protein
MDINACCFKLFPSLCVGISTAQDHPEEEKKQNDQTLFHVTSVGPALLIG